MKNKTQKYDNAYTDESQTIVNRQMINSRSAQRIKRDEI